MEVSLQTQIVSSAGAALILIAYVGHQLGRMDPRSRTYNVLNALGAAILFWVALRPLQAGFVVLEGTWTVVSLYALARAWRGPADNR
jgi:hypothetical protein